MADVDAQFAPGLIYPASYFEFAANPVLCGWLPELVKIRIRNTDGEAPLQVDPGRAAPMIDPDNHARVPAEIRWYAIPASRISAADRCPVPIRRAALALPRPRLVRDSRGSAYRAESLPASQARRAAIQKLMSVPSGNHR